jgi:NAD(P)-dependent dehydrogenase (short-subunit alcohol dehydrogenase family)
MAQQAKTALITGASGGIGKAAVQQLSKLGWQVFAAVHSADGSPGRARDGLVEQIQLDVCDEASIDRARREITEKLGGRGLDALINNAGMSADGPLELVPIAELRRQFEVNVVGQVAVTQAFLPLLRAAHGRVVNMGGAAGRMTLPMYGALSASKAALDTISDAFRMELKHQDVSVSYIEPGALRTEFFAKADKAARAAGRAGDPATQAIYNDAIEAATASLAKSPADPVEHAVKAIVKALTANKPAARYIVGRQARMGLFLLPKLPAGTRDRMLMSSLGLKADRFRTGTGATTAS